MAEKYTIGGTEYFLPYSYQTPTSTASYSTPVAAGGYTYNPVGTRTTIGGLAPQTQAPSSSPQNLGGGGQMGSVGGMTPQTAWDGLQRMMQTYAGQPGGDYNWQQYMTNLQKYATPPSATSGGMIPTISGTMGGYGQQGAVSGMTNWMANLGQNLLAAMMGGQIHLGKEMPSLEKMTQKYYQTTFQPDIATLQRQGQEARQKYTSGLWERGMGFSSAGARTMEEMRQQEAATINELVRRAREMARQAAMQDIQYQESSPTALLSSYYKRLRELGLPEQLGQTLRW